MAPNQTDIFKQALLKFRAAETLYSSKLSQSELLASSAQNELSEKSDLAENIAADLMQQIEGAPPLLNESDYSAISSSIDDQITTLRRLAVEHKQEKQALAELKKNSAILKTELEAALSEEKRARKRKIVLFSLFSLVAIASAVYFHFQWLEKTTLTFNITLDGNPLPGDKIPVISLDGKSFAIGDKIGLGSHKLNVAVKNAEPIEKTFRAFYGPKDLGTLSLTSEKGGLNLLSDPVNAEFELSDSSGVKKQGNLPAAIDGIPVGTYRLIVSRKGWSISTSIAISHNVITTNHTEFPYGSLTISSMPTGMIISTNGVQVGITPMTFSEIKPAQFTVSVSDGENEQVETISVGPKKAVKKEFVFQYGKIQLSTTPPGATVYRKQKKIGKTPLTLDHLLVNEESLQLSLEGYAETNISVQVENEVIIKKEINLTNLAYVLAIKRAREALKAGQLTEARTLTAEAMSLETNGLAAMELQDAIVTATANAEKSRVAAEQKKEVDRMAAEKSELRAIIERAIAAVGGRESIERFRLSKVVAESVGKRNGSDFVIRVTVYSEPPNKMRIDQEQDYLPGKIGPFSVSLSVNGKKTTVSTYCVTENSGWKIVPSLLGQTQLPLSEEIQKYLRHRIYVHECETLIPLLNSDVTLTKVTDAASVPAGAVGVTAKKTGHPDVTLLFEKSSDLLVGVYSQGPDEQGNIVLSCSRYSNYRNFSGLLCPTTSTSLQGSNITASETLLSIEPVQRFSDTVFNPPNQ